ncbi:flagellar biosynthetic protein FliO [Oceanisphaera sp. KMM 10153]|uniref:flagellar biosynthetic protein FliO n=1 Tax=Oceanisphaera submarina TaxID=3390193 RepID=UPI003974F980
MRLLSILLLLPATVLAQGPEVRWDSWALSSMLVIGVILLLGWVLRRLRGASLLGGSRQLKIVTSLALGQRERLLVVQVGEEQRLLGVTAQQISDLGKLEQPLAPEQAGALLARRSERSGHESS